MRWHVAGPIRCRERLGGLSNTTNVRPHEFVDHTRSRLYSVPRWVKILELGCSREVTIQPALPLSLVFFSTIPDTHHDCGKTKQRWSYVWIGRHCSHTLQGLSIRN